MGRRIYITGASGAGVTTLGQGLARALNLPHADVDDSYWLPTDPPFTQKRRVNDRLTLLRRALEHDGWVLSGSFDRWGDPLLSQVDLVLFVTAPTGIRLARLRARERARFGDRIEEGGDMAAIHAGFMAWAARYDDPGFSGRNRGRHEDWLQSLRYPVLRIDGTRPTEEQVKTVLDHPALTASYA
ncbi:AAA family ATPase [Thalassovita aquimarina]|uniref:Adenylate kinase n=1 Tax=Thalassovita aquimarina TaxID=2785917 RepID=A0ABS5HNZ4_9RHOB|nr:AAA family ATPase [Thalassovita aquimarina]MBR9650672.1 adenylate kinase [Thalassovita aquimarina]